MYSNLSTFTFGIASNHVASWHDDGDAISPLQRMGSQDITPRSSLVPDHQHRKFSKSRGSVSSSDEDERRRTTRSKMRAIDDGSRRPSLPTNETDTSYRSRRTSYAPATDSSTETTIDINERADGRKELENMTNTDGGLTATERMYNELNTT